MLVVLGTILFGGGTALGTVISGGITGIQTTASHTSQYDQVDFTCQWAVPDGSAPGDTFTLRLPDQLRWSGATQFSLKAPDGQVVARAQVSTGGLVTFTLSDYVTTHPTDVHGTCAFTTQLVATTTGGQEDLEFQVGADIIRVPLQTGPPCSERCGPDRTQASKAMWWTDGAQDRTQTVVAGPGTTAATTTVVLTDTPDPGLALDCSSVRARIGRTLDAVSTIVDPTDDAAHPAEVHCTPLQATARWTGVPAGEYTELWVQAEVVDPTLSTYTNRGTVTLNGAGTPVQGTVVRTDASGTGSGAIPTATPTATTPGPTVTTTTATPPPTTTAPVTSTTKATAPSSSTSSTTSPEVTASTSSTTTETLPSTSAGTDVTGASTTVVTGTTAVATPGSTSDRLAFTGALVWPLLLGGTALAVLGLVVTRSARRRAH